MGSARGLLPLTPSLLGAIWWADRAGRVAVGVEGDGGGGDMAWAEGLGLLPALRQA